MGCTCVCVFVSVKTVCVCVCVLGGGMLMWTARVSQVDMDAVVITYSQPIENLSQRAPVLHFAALFSTQLPASMFPSPGRQPAPSCEANGFLLFCNDAAPPQTPTQSAPRPMPPQERDDAKDHLRPVSLSMGRTRRESLVGPAETFGVMIFSNNPERSARAGRGDSDDEDGDNELEAPAPLGRSSMRAPRPSIRLSIVSSLFPSSSRLSDSVKPNMAIAKNWKSEQTIPVARPRGASALTKSQSASQVQSGVSSLATTKSSTNYAASFSVGPSVTSMYPQGNVAPEFFEIDPVKEAQRLLMEEQQFRARASSSVQDDVDRLGLPKHQTDKLRKSLAERPRSVGLRTHHPVAQLNA